MATARGEIDRSYSHQTAYAFGNPDIDQLQDLFVRTLEAGERQFIGQTGPVKTFFVGSGYPQVWVRDYASHPPLIRFYYGLEYLTQGLEEHLAAQGEDGRLYDWVTPQDPGRMPYFHPTVIYRSPAGSGGKEITIWADKNTVEADQESSAVDVAYQILKISGHQGWLSKEIKGRRLLDRLGLALEYILRDRFDSRHGLVMNGFTADFGDVSPVYADQRVIYLDEKTPLVVGLYTNAVFYQAAKELHEIYRTLGMINQAGFWQEKAESIKRNVNKYLWQEDKGFYRIHIVLTPELAGGYPDDSDIFALGGNALAVLFGIADDGQARRIFEVAERRQRIFNVSTVAGNLLPPYPPGFFKHAIMYEPYSYQNGGQWDWFAGRLLLAEFERGYATRATRQLAEIAKKNVDNQGFYEWTTREGKGRGSPNCLSTAGPLAGAVFHGLFGIDLSAEALSLAIRLGEQPGQIHLYQPATDTFVAYQYGYEKAQKMISVRYESNFPRAGGVKVLLPPGGQVKTVRLDAREVRFDTETIGEDTYLVLATDWRPHQVQIELR
jgi:hypothetical protein